MTRNNIFRIAGFALILLFTATGCKKEKVQQAIEDNTRYEVEAMMNDADESYNKAEFTEGDETTEFQAENEGLHEAYTLIETDMDDAGFKRGLEKRFLSCLRKLNLSDTQVAQMRKAFRAYEECKANDVRLHREAYKKLHIRIEAKRKELIALLRDGKISRQQFEEKMKMLRADFHDSLREIKKKHAAHLKLCYEKFLRHLKSIMTDRQWKAFVDCYR